MCNEWEDKAEQDSLEPLHSLSFLERFVCLLFARALGMWRLLHTITSLFVFASHFFLFFFYCNLKIYQLLHKKVSDNNKELLIIIKSCFEVRKKKKKFFVEVLPVNAWKDNKIHSKNFQKLSFLLNSFRVYKKCGHCLIKIRRVKVQSVVFLASCFSWRAYLL